MSAKAGFGGVATRAVAVAKDRVQPTIGFPPFRKVVSKLDMAVAVAQCIDPRLLVEIERGRMPPR